MKYQTALLVSSLALFSCSKSEQPPAKNTETLVPQSSSQPAISLSPANWLPDYNEYMAAQNVERTMAGSAEGYNGAVTVSYNALAARAGLEVLKLGGNAMDAALTAGMTQVTLTAGAPISFFGIIGLVYYEAATGKVYTMGGNWNTVIGETDPMSIPGGISFNSPDALYANNNEPSGRTALVGGFLKGVESAHQKFGSLPFETLFEPSIYIAEKGMPVTQSLAGQIDVRKDHLARLPETKAIFTKADGSFLQQGDTFYQPALAKTLRAIAQQGTDYMYQGPWGEKLVATLQAEGGKMTMEDLRSYEVMWQEPITAEIANGYVIHTNPYPIQGGTALIEAQLIAQASGLINESHWTESGASLRKALDIAQMAGLANVPSDQLAKMAPGMSSKPEARITRANAEMAWKMLQSGIKMGQYQDRNPKSSDDVVVIDKDGNIAAFTQSINCVIWGRTGIFVDGISIGDPGSFQQASIAATGPGKRLPGPLEQGIVFKDGNPVLGFASMGSGLHQRTFQGLLNVTAHGMSVEEAINTPDFFMPGFKFENGEVTNVVHVPEGKFSQQVLNEMGYEYKEIPYEESRFAGEGKWVAISRDPKTGKLEAASHNRSNSDAVAY